MTLSEKALSRLLDTHERVPPFRVLYNFDKLCMEIGHEDEKSVDAFASIISVITKCMPQEYKITESQLRDEVNAGLVAHPMTVPLYEVIDVARAVVEVQWQIIHELKDPFYEMRKQLLENENKYHKISNYERLKKRILLPTEVDEAPADLIRIYLKDTPFYDFFFYTQVQFRMPRDLFASHAFICAPPRHGKTQCIQSFCANFLKDPDPPGLFVLDPHGDLFLTLKERVDPSRLVVLDPVTNPPALNFLDFGTSSDMHALQSFTYLMSSLSGGLSDKQAGIAPYLFALLRQMPSPSLDTLRLIVEDDARTAEKSELYPYIQKLQPRAQDFFRKQFFGGMKETKQAIAWKIYAAMGSDAFAKMFSSSRNSFNAAECMRQRKVVLARGSETVLGEHGLPIFLQFVVSQCLMAALRRIDMPRHERHLCMLIVDEAKHVFNDQTERLLTECRKANVGYLAATQLLSQIPEQVRSAIYGATAIKIAGAVQSSDANQLSREMFCSPDFIRSMEPVRGSHADWAFYVQEVTRGRAVKVRMPYGVLESLPRVAETYVSPMQLPDPPSEKEQIGTVSSVEPRGTVTVSPTPQSGQPFFNPYLEFEDKPKTHKAETGATTTSQPLIKPGKQWN